MVVDCDPDLLCTQYLLFFSMEARMGACCFLLHDCCDLSVVSDCIESSCSQCDASVEETRPWPGLYDECSRHDIILDASLGIVLDGVS